MLVGAKPEEEGSIALRQSIFDFSVILKNDVLAKVKHCEHSMGPGLARKTALHRGIVIFKKRCLGKGEKLCTFNWD